MKDFNEFTNYVSQPDNKCYILDPADTFDRVDTSGLSENLVVAIQDYAFDSALKMIKCYHDWLHDIDEEHLA